MPSGRATVTPLPSRSPLDSGRVRRSPRGAASRCSSRIAASSDRRSAPAKPDQQQGAVAQAAQVVADRGEDLAQHADRGGEFLGREFAALGGVAADAGERLADHRLGGRHRAAGEVVQIADRGAAQVDRVDRQAALALGGEERHDVGGGRGQAGQRVAGAPGAPGGDPGAIGAPRVGGLGQPGEGVGGGAGGRQAAVERRQWGGDGAVEPAAHLDRRRAERRRDGVRQRIRRGGQGGRPCVRQRGGRGWAWSWRGRRGRSFWRFLAGLAGSSRARVPEIAMPDKGSYRAYEGREGGSERITGLLHQIARFA